MSRLRAKCPHCKTFTAVALGPGYECHACGAEFSAGLVRVPRAWGRDGETMAAAAALPLPYPETASVEEESLGEQTLVLATELPERPLVLGGCCCAHIGAVEGLAARNGRIALVWLDAHGDLNTPATSPSGNAWGMPLRMLLDSDAVEPDDTVLIGARQLDAGEEEFLSASAVHVGPDGLAAALEGTDGTYVAFDADVLEPGTVEAYMPERDGLRLDEVEALFRGLQGRTTILGCGLTGLAPAPANVEPLTRLCVALGV